MFLEINTFAREGTQIMPKVLNAKYISFSPFSPLLSQTLKINSHIPLGKVWACDSRQANQMLLWNFNLS